MANRDYLLNYFGSNSKFRNILFAFLMLFALSIELPAQVHVKGYYRKDGTYVRSHTRSSPSSRRASKRSSSYTYTPTKPRTNTYAGLELQIEMSIENGNNNYLATEVIWLRVIVKGKVKFQRIGVGENFTIEKIISNKKYKVKYKDWIGEVESQNFKHFNKPILLSELNEHKNVAIKSDKDDYKSDVPEYANLSKSKYEAEPKTEIDVGTRVDRVTEREIEKVTAQEEEYWVQFFVSKYRNKDFNHLEYIGSVTSIFDESRGLTKYLIGPFTSESQCVEKIITLDGQGYPKAFVLSN